MRNLLILAKWLANRSDIDVVEYVGQTACISLVNGRRVVKIPSHWSYSKDPEAAELLEGVLDHEAIGHGRFTDLEGRQKAEKAGLIKFNNLSASIANILEDIYIENKAIETYPGVKTNLARTVKILNSRGFFGSPVDFAVAGPAQLLIGGLLNVLRARLVPGQSDILAINVSALEELMPVTLGSVWTEVLEVAMRVKDSSSTEENIGLTIEIMKLLKDKADETQKEPPEGSEQSDEKDEQEEKSQDEDGSNNSGDSNESDQPSDGDGDGDSSESDSTDDHSASKEVGEESNASDQAGTGKGQARVADSILNAAQEEMPATEIGESISQAIGAVVEDSHSEMNVLLGKIPVDDATLRIASQVKSLSDELQEALLTRTLSNKSIKFTGKRLNSRVLARTRSGNAKVFNHKDEAHGLSTAVHILVDMSSSMDGQLDGGVNRINAAIGLVYGIGDLLDEFEVPFQINAFSTDYSVMKTYDQEWTPIRKKREQPYLYGGTMTGAAMQRSLSDLVVRPEDRKLIVVLTDGDTSDLKLLISCYAEAQALGIEVASVMIGPNIESIRSLSAKFGFEAKSINTSLGLGKFAVERILESI